MEATIIYRSSCCDGQFDVQAYRLLSFCRDYGSAERANDGLVIDLNSVQQIYVDAVDGSRKHVWENPYSDTHSYHTTEAAAVAWCEKVAKEHKLLAANAYATSTKVQYSLKALRRRTLANVARG